VRLEGVKKSNNRPINERRCASAIGSRGAASSADDEQGQHRSSIESELADEASAGVAEGDPSRFLN
jgi:hypothetical protein